MKQAQEDIRKIGDAVIKGADLTDLLINDENNVEEKETISDEQIHDFVTELFKYHKSLGGK